MDSPNDYAEEANDHAYPGDDNGDSLP